MSHSVFSPLFLVCPTKMALLDSISPSLIFALLAIVSIAWKYLTYNNFRKKSKGFLLPPGPAAEPILGHLRIIPADNPEYYFQQLSKELNSDILSFNVLGQPTIVLNSVEVAVDLLDRRGANYCDRPRFVLFEQMGWRGTLTVCQLCKIFFIPEADFHSFCDGAHASECTERSSRSLSRKATSSNTDHYKSGKLKF